MACLRSRRYDRYGYPYRPRPAGGSCLRDACLLDAGCCLGETGIRTYQRQISPRRPPCCHFTPTCSEYAAHRRC
ncbi:MAG: membrane protein insertion efficiency factor YidD [Pseudonocardiaceae bacterium]